MSGEGWMTKKEIGMDSQVEYQECVDFYVKCQQKIQPTSKKKLGREKK